MSLRLQQRIDMFITLYALLLLFTKSWFITNQHTRVFAQLIQALKLFDRHSLFNEVPAREKLGSTVSAVYLIVFHLPAGILYRFLQGSCHTVKTKGILALSVSFSQVLQFDSILLVLNAHWKIQTVSFQLPFLLLLLFEFLWCDLSRIILINISWPVVMQLSLNII